MTRIFRELNSPERKLLMNKESLKHPLLASPIEGEGMADESLSITAKILN